MKNALIIFYWVAITTIVSLLFLGLDYSFLQALLMAIYFLPTVLLAHYLLVDEKWNSDLRSLFGYGSLMLALLFTQYLIIGAFHSLFYGYTAYFDIPRLFSNPIFIWLILAVYYTPYRILIWKLEMMQTKGEDTPTVEFTSERRKVKVFTKDILYIESRDDEVWLYMIGGEKLRSKTNISCWATELGGGFIRIHRSFLVSRQHIERVEPTRIYINGTELAISRTYREIVTKRLT